MSHLIFMLCIAKEKIKIYKTSPYIYCTRTLTRLLTSILETPSCIIQPILTLRHIPSSTEQLLSQSLSLSLYSPYQRALHRPKSNSRGHRRRRGPSPCPRSFLGEKQKMGISELYCDVVISGNQYLLCREFRESLLPAELKQMIATKVTLTPIEIKQKIRATGDFPYNC